MAERVWDGQLFFVVNFIYPDWTLKVTQEGLNQGVPPFELTAYDIDRTGTQITGFPFGRAWEHWITVRRVLWLPCFWCYGRVAYHREPFDDHGRRC